MADIVWVKQTAKGQVHPATLVDATDDDSSIEEGNVVVRWQSTNSTEVVPLENVIKLSPARKRSPPQAYEPNFSPTYKKRRKTMPESPDHQTNTISFTKMAERKTKSNSTDAKAEGWGSQAANHNAGWGSQAANNANNNSGWGSQVANNANNNSGWGSQVPNHNAGWGSQVANNANNNSGWGSQAATHNDADWGSQVPNHLSGWGSAGLTGAASTTEVSWPSFSEASLHSAWTTLQYRQPTTGGRRIKSKYAIQSDHVLEVFRESPDEFFLRKHFGNRLKVQEIGVSACDSLEKRRTFGTSECMLIASKFEKSGDNLLHKNLVCNKMAGPHVKAFYLAGPKGRNQQSTHQVQKELDAIANFSELALSPGKLASRLELLVSPAARGPDKSPYVFELPLKHFEELDTPENKTMGCGFIPSNMLEELLGGGARAKDCVAVQVRIVSSDLGIFKGMLVRKRGITKILLPSSMKKVGRAKTTRKAGKKSVFLLFNSICPSTCNSMLERVINPNCSKVPTKSATKDLKGLGKMVERVLDVGWGIPSDVLSDYCTERSKHWESRGHAYLIGVSDCTDGGLPEGSVFLTGFGTGDAGRNVILTRSPCTERDDVVVLPVISQKPDALSNEDWNHLCSLSFGAVMFASPVDPGSKSLPELINNSDLDGDYFCCIWDPILVSHVEKNTRNNHEDALEQEIVGEETAESTLLAQEDGDDILGVQVPLLINNKSHDGVVQRKLHDGRYLVKSGAHVEIMSREEIMRDKQTVEEILAHRGKGRAAELNVRWGDGTKAWQSLAVLKDEVPDIVAQYALEAGLLDMQGWAWARDYIHDAEIVEVCSHRFLKNGIEVEVLYDGFKEAEWIDARSVDVDIMARYVGENDISLRSSRWQWLDKLIENAKDNWFASTQDYLADVKHMAEHDRLVKKLHTLHKNRGDINDADAKALGRAYKRALDVGKHGGRVPLPRHLRDEVSSKTSCYANKFIKVEDEFL